MSIRIKQVLEGNVLRKSQGELLIDGLETAGIIHITFGDIASEMDVIELPDRTKVPTGIGNAGEFDVEIQLAHRESLNAYISWAMMGRDRSTDGLNPQYKRNGTIIYHRLFQGGGETAAGRALPNERVRLFGMFVQNYTLPGMEMDSTDDNRLALTLSYDDVLPMDKGLGV